MATFPFHGLDIYYEDRGAGRPFLLLNGIFMSCSSWTAFLDTFSAHNRLIMVDLLDQGRSGKADFEYTQALQVELVATLLDHLGIERLCVMGISYGGEVAMGFALDYPSRVEKLILANTAAHTSKWLRDIGHSWEFAYRSYDGHQFFKTCIPIIYSPQFYEANYEWISAREDLFVRLFTPEVYDAFGRLTRSAEGHDVRKRLGEIKARTLVISSEHDYVTPPFQQAELAGSIPGAGHVVIQGAGHASMYEKPEEFAALVLGFLNGGSEIRITK